MLSCIQGELSVSICFRSYIVCCVEWDGGKRAQMCNIFFKKFTDEATMLEFSTCRYITDDHHIILKGASGNGKTFIACALGVAACKNFIKVRYLSKME